MSRTKTTARKSTGGKVPCQTLYGNHSSSPSNTFLICSYNWIIRNYTFCFDETNSILTSPIFVVRSIPNTEWHLRLSQESNSMGLHLVTNCMGEASFSEEVVVPPPNERRSSLSSFSNSENSEDEKDAFTVKLKIIGPRGEIKKSFYRRRKPNPEGELTREIGSSCFITKEKMERDIPLSDTITIFCDMYLRQHKKTRDNYVAKTRILVDRFTWGYKFNSSQLIDTNRKIPVKDGSFGISGISFLKNENLKIKIHFCKQKMNKYHGFIIDCNIALLNGSYEICSEKRQRRFDSAQPFWEFHLDAFSLQLPNLVSSVKEKEFTLLCEFAFSNGKRLHTLVTDPKEEDLRSIFLRKTNCGVSFEADEVVEASRTVLAAQSPSIFEQTTPQNQSVRTVEEFAEELSIVNSFLECLNADHIENMDYERVKVVLLNAEKYSKQLSYLKEKSLAFLKSTISEKNACDILSLADASHCSELKERVVDFLVADSGGILSSPQWLEWIKDNMQLASCVLSTISIRLSTLQFTEFASTSNSEHQQKKRRAD